MVGEAEVTKEISPEMEQTAAQLARERARPARWDIDIAVFLFAILIIVIILLFQDIPIEVVAPVAIFGLVMVWFLGWRRGRQLYERFYGEELAKLVQQSRKLTKEKEKAKEIIEETIEEKVQKALRERWR